MTKELKCPECESSRIEKVSIGAYIYTDINGFDESGNPAEGCRDIEDGAVCYRCKDCMHEAADLDSFIVQS